MRDVLIIGSGAGGGPLAYTLARAGAEVTVLERGPWIRRGEFPEDEVQATRRSALCPSPYDDPHALMREGATVSERTDMGWIGRCVGGGTVVMGSNLFRFHPEDFQLRSRKGAYEEIEDWPYDYAELEPYYTRAERRVGVAGLAGANPYEGRRSAPYPLPPLDDHPLTGRFDRVCRNRGWYPFPTPRGINSRSFRGRPACRYCEDCAGYGCNVGAKGSSQEALLSRALATGRCEILSEAMARKVLVDERGRATGCLALDRQGNERRFRARVVCVCCSAVESARLLLLSHCRLFPDGLGNDAGLVGRYLQFHAFSGGLALFAKDRDPEGILADQHPFFGRSLMDFYFLPREVAEFSKGGILRFGISTGHPIGLAQRLLEETAQRPWGEPLVRLLDGFLERYLMLNFEVFHDFLPNQGSFVDLDPDQQDSWGLPIARIHLREPEHHRVAGRWLLERCLEIVGEMGAEDVTSLAIGKTSGYLVQGTCRAGNDPRTSVLDAYCQVHGIPNLYVVDGSFMPTSGGAPPTLTILANSFRTADAILDRGRAGDFG